LNTFTNKSAEFVFSLLNPICTSLDTTSLLAKVEKHTGLDDWGDLNFQEPLDVLLDSLKHEANLSQQGRFIVGQNYTRLLENILKLIQEWKEHPEIFNKELKPPLFILGFPRTGTTYLHSLLSLDPNHRALRFWELLFPTPRPHPETYSSDSRIRKSEWFTWFIDKISPNLANIHQLQARGVEECCFIFDHFFLDNINHLVFDIPTYIDFFWQHDHVPSYRFHYQMLQHYAYNFSFDRYILKAPRHLSCLDALLKVYPDAMIVWTHRDPCKAVASLCSLSETARQIISNLIDKQRLGELCLQHLVNDFEQGYPVRKKANSNQFFDIHCNELNHNPIQCIKNIYQYFDLNYSDEYNELLHQSLQQNLRKQTGIHCYNLIDYGLTESEVHKRLHGYYKLFHD